VGAARRRLGQGWTDQEQRGEGGAKKDSNNSGRPDTGKQQEGIESDTCMKKQQIDQKPSAQKHSDDEASATIKVSNQEANWISDSGGHKRIRRELERRSGARITVVRGGDQEPEAVVISGTKEAVKMAEQYVVKLVRGPPAMTLTDKEVVLLTSEDGRRLGLLRKRNSALIFLKSQGTQKKELVIIGSEEEVKKAIQEVKKLIMRS
jgi:hypothetical protein